MAFNRTNYGDGNIDSSQSDDSEDSGDSNDTSDAETYSEDELEDTSVASDGFTLASSDDDGPPNVRQNHAVACFLYQPCISGDDDLPNTKLGGVFCF